MDGKRGRRALRVGAVLIVGLVGFYVLPVDLSAADVIPRGIVCVLALAGLGWLFVRQIRAQTRAFEDGDVRLESLFYLVALTAYVFAFAYYALATVRPGEFTGLVTRTDALYFTVTTMVTVGYGDVAATGQTARLLVIAHMVFDVVFVGAFVSVLRARVGRRKDRKSDGRPSLKSTNLRVAYAQTRRAKHAPGEVVR